MKFLNITCPVDNCDHLSDEEFKAALTESSNQIATEAASCHGKNAYRIFGTTIASAKIEIDRHPDSLSTVTFRLAYPADVPMLDFVEHIQRLWNKTMFSTGEFFDDYRFCVE